MNGYNTVLSCAKGLLAVAGALPKSVTGDGKTRLFLDGQARALTEAARFDAGKENYWFHCASLGEYAIARPLMAELKRRRPEARIALTFFSSTGVEALRKRSGKSAVADFVGYLPLDTHANASRLLDLFRPSAVLFMVSEYWPNFLAELRHREIPVFLVACIFTDRTPHFKPVVGKVFRNSLQAYTHIFCLNRGSVDTLARLGFSRASVEGDPLVDNAIKISEASWDSVPLRDFCSRSATLICGSIHNGADMELVAPEINAHSERRYVLVPHEVDEAHLRAVEATLKVPSRRLGDWSADMTEHVLIVDNIGSLAYLYRFGTLAYIGGGFSRQLHSVIEASVYGLPISFGPRIERKIVARLMIKLGVATVVATPGEFSAWADRYFTASAAELDSIRAVARKFCGEQAGATRRIVSTVLNSLKWSD